MDSSVEVLLAALREMETCLGEWLAGRSTSPTRCASAFVWRTAVYVDDEGLAFDSEPFYDNLDEELFVDPVVNTEPASNHTAVIRLRFATLVCTVHDHFTDGPVFDDLSYGPVLDTYSDGFVGVPVFDTDSDTPDSGPVFDIETNYSHVAVAAIDFTESEFDADFAFSDKGPDDLFTTRLGTVLDEGPLFNEEPEPMEEDLTFVKQFVLDSNSTIATTTMDVPCTCSTKCLSIVVNTTNLHNAPLAWS
jgi:hypothetical protein